MLVSPILFINLDFVEDRLHLKNIQIYLVFCSVCTIFASDLKTNDDEYAENDGVGGPDVGGSDVTGWHAGGVAGAD